MQFERTKVDAHTAVLARDTVQPEALRAFTDLYLPKIGEFLESVGATPTAARVYHFGGSQVGAGFSLDDADVPMAAPFIGDIGDDLVDLVQFDDTQAVAAVFDGPRSEIPAAWDEFEASPDLGELRIEDYAADSATLYWTLRG